MKAADPRSPRLAIHLFGPFEAQVGGDALPHLRTRRGEWLLALLALRAGQAVERGWLAGTLWPDSPAGQALSNLRGSLTDLRRALGAAAGCVCAPSPRSLALDLPAVDVDVIAFDRAIARGDAASLEAAAALYRGPLLEGCGEEWAFQERQAREQAYLAARERLAALAFEEGKAADAERHLRLAVAIDPLRESTQRALMQVLAAGGNYAAALLCYRDLRLRLHRELNTAPDPETQTLFQQLRSEARRLAAKGSEWQGLGVMGQVSVPAGMPAPLAGGFSRRSLVREPETAAPLRHNLPRPLTRTIGREPEIRTVLGLLADHPLVTLTGAGGCGKSRLALEVARAGARSASTGLPADGVWLVELAPLADPALVPQTVAATLGVREEPGLPLTETLVNTLRSRSLWLVLDNCEHLIEASARLVERLLHACPHLTVLATSREPLAVPGERSYLVPSLSTSDAVQLFLDRAATASPSFRPTEAERGVLAAICTRLDGMPLAIELAAAWAKILPLPEIAARLDDRFRLLTRGSRTALPRHQTLRASIDWSYDLLAEKERVLLRRLSVFAGGWTLEAAEAVCAGDGIEEWEVLDLLTSLVEKSMLLLEKQEAEARYRMLETVREYALNRLKDASEEEDLHLRHRNWFLQLAERFTDEIHGPGHELWLDRLEKELGNFHAALERAHSSESALPDGLRLVAALGDFWKFRGYFTEGRQLLERALSRSSQIAATPARGIALELASCLAGWCGEKVEARKLAEESVALFRQLGDRRGLALALGQLGNTFIDDDPVIASQFQQEGVSILREIGEKRYLVWKLMDLGISMNSGGDAASAQCLYQEALTLAREQDLKQGIAQVLLNRAILARHQGDHTLATACFSESLAIFAKLGNRWHSALCIEGLARLASAAGQSERGARLLGAAAHQFELVGAPVRAINPAVRAALSEEAFAAAWAEGRAMSLNQATAYALENGCDDTPDRTR